MPVFGRLLGKEQRELKLSPSQLQNWLQGQDQLPGGWLQRQLRGLQLTVSLLYCMNFHAFVAVIDLQKLTDEFMSLGVET